MKWLIIGPQTRAARAQEMLLTAGIRAQRKKLTQTGEGCIHAVGVSDDRAEQAAAVLRGAGIRVRTITD